MQAIKGFDADLKCRGFQFEVGKTYTHDGNVIPCKSGFHAIKNDAHPLSVFQYYPASGSRFCIVELSGDVQSDDGVKVAAQILNVQREIGLHDLADEAVKWVMARTKSCGAASNSGTRGAASNSGDYGAASNSGTQGAAMNSAYGGKVMGCEGSALFAVERDDNYNIISVASGIVGKKSLKPDIWYICKGGKLVKAEQ